MVNIANVIDSREAIHVINRYKEIIKTQNEKTIGYVVKADLHSANVSRATYVIHWRMFFF